jgi:hypothetical protein
MKVTKEKPSLSHNNSHRQMYSCMLQRIRREFEGSWEILVWSQLWAEHTRDNICRDTLRFPPRHLSTDRSHLSDWHCHSKFHSTSWHLHRTLKSKRDNFFENFCFNFWGFDVNYVKMFWGKDLGLNRKLDYACLEMCEALKIFQIF